MRNTLMSRRTLLRGMGAGAGLTVGLPCLEAMTDSRGRWMGRAGAAEKPPVRLLTVWWPNGTSYNCWTPSGIGESYVSSTGLAPLERHRAKINILTGLYNPGSIKKIAGGGHAGGTGAFGNAMPVGATGAGGPSVDQVAAQKLGHATKFRSLPIAPDRKPGNGDGGDGTSDAVYNLSWAAANQPVPPYVNPLTLYRDFFASVTNNDNGELARLVARRGSVLDFVKRDAQRLNGRLGAGDRTRLDAHLTAVRELERQTLDSVNIPQCAPPAEPKNDPVEAPFYAAHVSPQKVNLMMDYLALAFACDLTRYASFRLAVDVGAYLQSLVGKDSIVTAYRNGNEAFDHHAVSHDDSGKAAGVINIYTRFQVELFAGLLDRLDKFQEGDGTLLDNSLIYFANEVGDGAAHNHANLPIVVAGRAGGAVRGGRHHAFLPERQWKAGVIDAEGRSVADLFLAMLKYAGVNDATSFGLDSRSPLELG